MKYVDKETQDFLIFEVRWWVFANMAERNLTREELMEKHPLGPIW